MAYDQCSPSTIVLLAHGPATDTLNAARRLEPCVDDLSDIIVIQATPPGATAVDRASERGYSTTSIDIPLTDLLAQLSGRVLVLHDDVSIDEEAIDELSRQHALTGQVTVPVGGGHAAGPIDLVCALGSSTQLVLLASRAGFGPGMMVDDDTILRCDVPMTHAGTCQQRRTRPHDLGHPVLVAAIIVRDEEDQIGDCLASLEDVVDRIEVCDTGSIDRTAELARAAGANVTQVDWRNDFAWARNHVLERCTDAAYMLWIDADERLYCDDPREFREMLATYSRVYPSYGLTLHNMRADGTETHSFVARRIADPSLVRFTGAIHEQAVRLDGAPLVTAFVTNVSIRHFGYDESVVDLRQKMERNLRVAREGFEKDPSETNAVQLARALKGASTNPEDTLRQLGPIEALLTDAPATVRALMFGLRAELLLAADRLDEATEAAKGTLELVPADATAGAVLAEALRRSNKLDELVASAADYASRPSPPPLFTDHVACQTRARIIFEAALRLDDIDTACVHAFDLPPELDPWPVLSSHLSIDRLVDLAPSAGSTADQRFVEAAVSRDELTHEHLDRLQEAFSAFMDAAVARTIEEARQNLLHMDQHVELRRLFVQSGEFADAVLYARCLCAGQVDLGLSLDDIDDLHDPTAAALSLAAVAHERRGDIGLAEVDARESMKRWPGATRAAVLVAEACLRERNPLRALAAVHATRDADHHDRLTRDRRHDLARLATRAHLEMHDLASAIREAAEIVDADGSLQLWEQLLTEAGQDMNSATLVLGLALLGDGVDFVDALAAAVGPGRTGQLCAAYLGLGGANADAVSTGILAAVLAGQDELALVIAEHGSLVPDEIRSRLAQHLRENSACSVADRLEADQLNADLGQFDVASPR